VIELLGGRRFEGIHLAALRVHAGHHVLDGAILAGGIHGLKNQQQRPFILRIEPPLQLGERFETVFQQIVRVFLRFQFPGIVRLKILQAKFAAIANAIAVRQVFERDP